MVGEHGRNEIDSTWRRVSELTAPPFAINFGRGSCHGIFMPIRYPGTGSCESPGIPTQGEIGGKRSWSTGFHVSLIDDFINNENDFARDSWKNWTDRSESSSVAMFIRGKCCNIRERRIIFASHCY